jgi:hypothetical protein
MRKTLLATSVYLLLLTPNLYAQKNKILPNCSTPINPGILYNELGSGTVDDPYLIHTPDQIYSMARAPQSWTKNFKQCKDIAFTNFYGPNKKYFSIGSDASELPTLFSGVYDGNNKKIIGFTYDVTGPHYLNPQVTPFLSINNEVLRKSDNYLGLFSRLGNNAVVKNLVLENFKIFNNYMQNNPTNAAAPLEYAGIVGAYAENVTIDNIVIKKSQIQCGKTQYVGGVLGYSKSTTLNNINTQSLTIAGHNATGGVVGKFQDSNLNNSVLSSNVKDNYSIYFTAGSNAQYALSLGGAIGESEGISSLFKVQSTSVVLGITEIGGLVGRNSGQLTMNKSFVLKGSVLTTSSYTGGLIGYSYGVSNVYRSAVNVKITSLGNGIAIPNSIGGLIGSTGTTGGTIENSFSQGTYLENQNTIISKKIGGLVGENRSFIKNSYANFKISTNYKLERFGGLVGVNNFASIQNSFAVAQATFTGGTSNSMNNRFIGQNVGNSTIQNAFYTTNTNCSNCSNSSLAQGTTLNALKTANHPVYANWDTSVWIFMPNQLPTLSTN